MRVPFDKNGNMLSSSRRAASHLEIEEANFRDVLIIERFPSSYSQSKRVVLKRKTTGTTVSIGFSDCMKIISSHGIWKGQIPELSYTFEIRGGGFWFCIPIITDDKKDPITDLLNLFSKDELESFLIKTDRVLQSRN